MAVLFVPSSPQTITLTGLTDAGQNVSNLTSTNIASVTLVAGEVYLLGLQATMNGNNLGIPNTVTWSVGSQAWTRVEPVTGNTGSGAPGLSYWIIKPTTGGTGNVAISWGTSCVAIVHRITRINGGLKTGTNGIDAIVQSIAATPGADPISVTLPSSITVGNLAYAISGGNNNNSQTCTWDAGYSEITDRSWNMGGWYGWLSTALSVNASDPTPTATWSGTGSYGLIVAELAAEPGVAQYISIGGTLNVFQNQVEGSVDAWVYPTASSATGRIFDASTASSATARVMLRLSAGALSCEVRRQDGDSGQVLTAGATLSINQWHHIAVSIDWANQSLRLYADGVQVGSSTPAGWTGATSNTASAVINVGAGTAEQEAFPGAISNLRTWRRALTAAEISYAAMARGADRIRYGLYNNWLLNNGINGATLGSSAARDYGQGNNQGSGVNSPVWSAGLLTRPKAPLRGGA